ncbi:heavy metal-binding domain-containing protein [Sphingobacterium sp. BN32]|nr:heavy metal-binding domain-containing protein [Sphingobacterium sp. BN32]WKK57384.1 heavy metal-binding domain-containing protein [Sphingobacterium sp. BN32]
MKKYTCPMHPQVLKDEPGKCPLCGMALVPGGGTSASHEHTPEHEHSGHSQHGHDDENFDKHEGHNTGDFLTRFWISLVITIPILLLSHMIQQWLGFSLAFNGDKYVLLALGTVIYCYGGLPFLKGMIGEVKAKAIGMMTLVAIAISVAYVYSVAVVFGLQGMDFF